ncbi:MAG: hypothetical protein A2Y03_07660 [Omnitrophica WOR_2 bacterium GWF2_38_59]|nr:MAG: hypothetical protein A2Y03_07660 [Omnitrophica WOR_2 bacterium GWF2_38_59]OGX49444.1 MAG: hypothetical protein A2243_09535 [Omnitrophica WOR_2 bacterium RIFOXYA2_FULL_38_17]OGX54844.1 MAG: hypothetical protein A2267_07340 [Omnitrophica WOR_2 bacterium RIFOXYA12_FULL_38_10]OGX55949.1 MAG: hypothetical protein A2306_12460 [Omnitrophica WOR_2 bacterium RIFOXYB2_FULL_38_16]OGX57816.1 MAG: hypothetical protein A2447_06965 [Omnitrophica WOR_2 bacterium RIFOXYC2_FULL_38_12]HBG62458.1 hypothet
MTEIDKKELLKNRKVVEEINRHLWIESEKAGTDISFEVASEDWLKRFSKAWMDYHMQDSDAFKGPRASKNPRKDSTKAKR